MEVLFETASYIHYIVDGEKIRICKLYDNAKYERKVNGVWTETLEFKMDVSLDDEMDTFIPEGTVVNVWPGPQREGSTRIMYNGEVIEYMNFTFKGGK